MHLALGASLPDSGGVNKSAIHWDMVNSLQEGKVYVDGELCYEAGAFFIQQEQKARFLLKNLDK